MSVRIRSRGNIFYVTNVLELMAILLTKLQKILNIKLEKRATVRKGSTKNKTESRESNSSLSPSLYLPSMEKVFAATIVTQVPIFQLSKDFFFASVLFRFVSSCDFLSLLISIKWLFIKDQASKFKKSRVKFKIL